MNVLFISSDPALQQRVSGTSPKSPCKFTFVTNQKAAYSALNEAEFDCICIATEITQSIEFCNAVRAKGQYERTPVIYIAERLETELSVQLLDSGFTGIFLEHEQDELLGCIEKLSRSMEPIAARVLLVSHNRMPRIEILNCRAGITFDACVDWNAAWLSYQENDYDLILVDSEIESYAADTAYITNIRRLEGVKKSNVPILLVTDTDNERRRLNFYYLGASDYIVIPFAIDELAIRIHNLLETRLSYINPVPVEDQKSSDIQLQRAHTLTAIGA